ncbi:MAG: Xaa-Pro peptidase family protein [Halobacteria archaeon]|nr:Xaa-Pro peptidase family protein [Halobacteria archaeon]
MTDRDSGRTTSIDEAVEEEGCDAYLRTDSSDDSDMYYVSGFEAPDPFSLLRTQDETVLLVSPLEYSRAKKESLADEVRSTAEYTTGDIRGSEDAEIEVAASFLEEYGVESVCVPRDFFLYTAEALRERGFEVTAVDDGIEGTRAVKTDEEIRKIKAAQRANENAMEVAERLLREAEVKDGRLVHEEEALTSERLRTEIEVDLIRARCDLDESIVASGSETADPHSRGSGAIEAGEPVIVDIFPRRLKYHADMTRTFVKGEPTDEVREMYEATVRAQEAAFDVLDEGAGVTGEEVHDAVCDSYEEVGYDTERQGAEEGFIHSTGHGVGLDIHEMPRLSSGGGELEAGHVVSVEPGLYYQDVGGVRVEDLVVVRDGGYDNLTEYEKGIENLSV